MLMERKETVLTKRELTLRNGKKFSQKIKKPLYRKSMEWVRSKEDVNLKTNGQITPSKYKELKCTQKSYRLAPLLNLRDLDVVTDLSIEMIAL